MFQMCGVFAEFESNLRPECQSKGIALAKEKGVCEEHPKGIDDAKSKALEAGGKPVLDICSE